MLELDTFVFVSGFGNLFLLLPDLALLFVDLDLLSVSVVDLPALVDLCRRKRLHGAQGL